MPVERGSIMAAFGCNFEGDIPLAHVLDTGRGRCSISARRAQLDIKVVSLADTMAWATPPSIRRVVGAVRETVPGAADLRCICTTRAAWASPTPTPAWRWASTSSTRRSPGLGGCPFAAHKGAAGNVCTEDLVFMCEEMGIETGIDLGQADRGGAARRGDRRPSAAGLRDEGRQPGAPARKAPRVLMTANDLTGERNTAISGAPMYQLSPEIKEFREVARRIVREELLPLEQDYLKHPEQAYGLQPMTNLRAVFPRRWWSGWRRSRATRASGT